MKLIISSWISNNPSSGYNNVKITEPFVVSEKIIDATTMKYIEPGPMGMDNVEYSNSKYKQVIQRTPGTYGDTVDKIIERTYNNGIKDTITKYIK